MSLVRSLAGSMVKPLASAITGASGGEDTYAANGFSPDYVADFSATSADYFRVAGNDSDFATAFTSDSEGGGLATQVDSSGNLVWRAHNLVLNSATPATQSITVVSGADYTVEITGSGSVALTGAGSGTVTAGNPVEITASTTTLTLTVTGSPSTMWVYRSDLGGVADNPDRGDSYVPTTTAARYLARRRHHRWDGSAWVPTCLHEPVGATNNVDFSNDLTSGNWSIGLADSLTITPAQAAGPDGNTSLAEVAITDATNESHTIKQDGGGFGQGYISASTDYVMSAYVRDNDQRYISLWLFGNTNHWANVTFDLQLGTKTQTSTGATSGTVNGADLIDLGGGLYRIWMSAQVSSVAGTQQWGLRSNSSGTPSLDTNGAESYAGTAGVSYYAGFTQFEAGLLPSSHIPTNGATVTRTADTLKGKAASLPYSSTAMSLALKARTSNVLQETARILSWNGGTTNNRISMFRTSTSANATIRGLLTQGGSNASSDSAGTVGSYDADLNVALRVAGGSEVQLALAGAAATADTSAVPTIPDLSARDLQIFDSSVVTGKELIGTVDTIRLWDEDVETAGIEEATA